MGEVSKPTPVGPAIHAESLKAAFVQTLASALSVGTKTFAEAPELRSGVRITWGAEPKEMFACCGGYGAKACAIVTPSG